jgi:hypothetical protein
MQNPWQKKTTFPDRSGERTPRLLETTKTILDMTKASQTLRGFKIASNSAS